MYPYRTPDKPDVDAAAREYRAEQGKQLGGCLTAWMGVSLAVSLISAFVIFQLLDLLRPGNLRPGANAAPVIFYIVAVAVMLLINIASLYGMWNWKRWGVYGVASISIISPIVELIAGTAVTRDFVQPFIQLGILWFLIRDKWEYFE